MSCRDNSRITPCGWDLTIYTGLFIDADTTLRFIVGWYRQGAVGEPPLHYSSVGAIHELPLIGITPSASRRLIFLCSLSIISLITYWGCIFLLKGILISVAAGLATGIGAIPVLIFQKIPPRLHDTLLGLAAGIMIAAASFSLLVPALKMGGLIEIILGIIAAGIFIFAVEKLIPHLHPHFSKQPPQRESRLCQIRAPRSPGVLPVGQFPYNPG
jgi:hypothetical protein